MTEGRKKGRKKVVIFCENYMLHVLFLPFPNFHSPYTHTLPFFDFLALSVIQKLSRGVIIRMYRDDDDTGASVY